MKKRLLTVFASFLVFLLFANIFGFSSTGLATLYMQKEGNLVNYRVADVENFAQCFDSEPSNNVYEKGTCFTQFHRGSDLYGVSSVDFCNPQGQVIDYYCSSSMVCTEVVNECKSGYICEDGKCVKSFKPFKYWNLNKLGSGFRNLLIRTY